MLGKDELVSPCALRGGVVSLEPDPELSDIDRLSQHYLGQPYAQRDRGRVSAWIGVDSWHAWAVREPWSEGR